MTDTTHAPGCWGWGPKHYECALREIELLAAEWKRVTAAQGEAEARAEERPIIFSAPMVRAILAGAKTQTRRLVRPQPEYRHGVLFPQGSSTGYSPSLLAGACPYGRPGDRLWVREAWRVGAWDEIAGYVAIDYKADGYCRREWLRVDDEDLFIRLWQQCIDDARAALGPADRYTWEPGRSPCRWRPSIHMPRWASRITLEITDVRVERLQEISEADAIAEGIDGAFVEDGRYWRNYSLSDDEAMCAPMLNFPTESYRTLWESINGPGSWDANPFVWVVTFRRIDHA